MDSSSRKPRQSGYTLDRAQDEQSRILAGGPGPLAANMPGKMPGQMPGQMPPQQRMRPQTQPHPHGQPLPHGQALHQQHGLHGPQGQHSQQSQLNQHNPLNQHNQGIMSPNPGGPIPPAGPYSSNIDYGQPFADVLYPGEPAASNGHSPQQGRPSNGGAARQGSPAVHGGSVGLDSSLYDPLQQGSELGSPVLMGDGLQRRDTKRKRLSQGHTPHLHHMQNQMNQMNQLNMNQMSQLNQMNQMNQINQLQNHMQSQMQGLQPHSRQPPINQTATLPGAPHHSGSASTPSASPGTLARRATTGTANSSLVSADSSVAGGLAALEAAEEPETELRHVALELLRFPLEHCVQRVRENETGPLSEKMRQVFGMNWLLRSCEPHSEANVPRNRIYARYVEICADYNLKPLNPASFGKLVRLIFPNIKTRRLGVRGHSKYHYCGIVLSGDMASATGNTPNTSMATRSPSPSLTPSSASASMSTTSINASAAVAAQLGINGSYNAAATSTPPHNRTTSNGSNGQPSSSLYGLDFGAAAAAAASAPVNKALPSGMFDFASNSTMQVAPPSAYARPAGAGAASDTSSGAGSRDEEGLREFKNFAPSTSLDDFTLPPIQDYLSPDVDPDAAATLQGLYKTHCRSLIEQLRYMRIKKLFTLMNSFSRGLTSPVLRVLKQEDTVRWVTACDRLLYREMVHLMAPLVLQQWPAEVSQSLQALSTSLPTHLDKQAAVMPESFVRAKKQVAGPFVQIVDRLLRANQAAQNAGRILASPLEVAKMRQDWVACVTPTAVRDAPCARDTVLQILLVDIPGLLAQPKQEPGLNSPGSPASESNPSGSANSSGSTDGDPDAIDRWVRFLGQLPDRVPRMPSKLFLLVTSAVATAALRDLNRAGGESFGAWWVLRCWVDEYLAWTVELDAFMQPNNQESFDELLKT